jgi:hypothetical protein
MAPLSHRQHWFDLNILQRIVIIPRVATAELLAQVRNKQTERLENQVMVLGEFLHQRQSRRHRLVDAVCRDSHDDTE